MTLHQKIFAITASILVFIFIVEMVRRRRLKEEYSWLWFFAGGMMVVLTIWYDSLVFFSRLIGAVAPTTTLFIFSILFLVIISIHYSLIISRLTEQIKNLAQELTLLRRQVEKELE